MPASDGSAALRGAAAAAGAAAQRVRPEGPQHKNA